MNNRAFKIVILILGLATIFSAIFMAIAATASALTGFTFLDAAAALQSIGILVALCIGGIFAQQRFRLFRVFQPHLTVTQQVSHRHIGNSYIHIAITATLFNASKVHVEIPKAEFLLQKISPISDAQIQELYDQVFSDPPKTSSIQWPTIEHFTQEWNELPLTIEPGASHKETFEFITNTHASTFLIYTYFHNSQRSEDSKSSQGWRSTTIYDL